MKTYRHIVYMEDFEKHWVGNIQQALEYFVAGVDACDREPSNRRACGYIEPDRDKDKEELEALNEYLMIHPDCEHRSYLSCCNHVHTEQGPVNAYPNNLEFYSDYQDIKLDELFEKRVRAFCDLHASQPRVRGFEHTCHETVISVYRQGT